MLGQLLRGKSAPNDSVPEDELYERDFDPGVGGGVDRDKLPSKSFAGPHRSFPIVNQKDVSDAMRLSGHAADPAAVRAKIARIAKAKGLKPPGQSESEITFGSGRFKEAFAVE